MFCNDEAIACDGSLEPYQECVGRINMVRVLAKLREA